MDTNVHEIDTSNNNDRPTPSESTSYPVTNQADEHSELQPMDMVAEVCKNIKIEDGTSHNPVVDSQGEPQPHKFFWKVLLSYPSKI